MPRSSRVTLEAISRELNLSTSSVSRALRNDPLIHPQTRAEVNAMAMRMGYQGRSRRGPQATSRQRSIGVLFASSSLTDIKRHIITMSYLQGMTSEAAGANMVLNLQAAQEVTDGATRDAVFDFTQADAWLICGAHEQESIARIARMLPIVSVVQDYPGLNHDMVSTDDFSGTSQLVSRLVELGHRRCVFVCPRRNKLYIRLRTAGFLEGARVAGLDLAEQVVIEDEFEDGKIGRPEAILQAIRRGATAVMSDSDHTAYEIAELLAREGIEVPRDVSLTGYNAIGAPGKKSLRFTSYDPNFVEMGRAAVRLAKWRLENPSAALVQVTVRGKVVDGETIAPPPGRTASKTSGSRSRKG
jgi:DNA-binding LacI/PurR family transcriptional regulator